MFVTRRTVIDPYYNRFAIVDAGNSHETVKRQIVRSGRHGSRIKTLTARGTLARGAVFIPCSISLHARCLCDGNIRGGKNKYEIQTRNQVIRTAFSGIELLLIIRFSAPDGKFVITVFMSQIVVVSRAIYKQNDCPALDLSNFMPQREMTTVSRS